mmetsp:Transcript_13266/g.26171  ORF Transcript_13266/g.26171 Transcript_13266/m.26171 type:complete len:240 (+) Transcript_13266:362-1081(+)
MADPVLPNRGFDMRGVDTSDWAPAPSRRSGKASGLTDMAVRRRGAVSLRVRRAILGAEAMRGGNGGDGGISESRSLSAVSVPFCSSCSASVNMETLWDTWQSSHPTALSMTSTRASAMSRVRLDLHTMRNIVCSPIISLNSAHSSSVCGWLNCILYPDTYHWSSPMVCWRSMSSYGSLRSGLSIAVTTGRQLKSPASRIRNLGASPHFIRFNPSLICFATRCWFLTFALYPSLPRRRIL